MTNEQVVSIEVSIGQLPQWYLEDEGNCDLWLEQAISENIQGEFGEIDITISYNYQTEQAVLKAYNDDGDLLFTRDYDYQFALNFVETNH